MYKRREKQKIGFNHDESRDRYVSKIIISKYFEKIEIRISRYIYAYISFRKYLKRSSPIILSCLQN